MGWKRKKLDSMGDEDLCDVHLVGTDGEEVPCNKAFLSTTSPVFKSMFYRGFREQKSDRCSLDFHSLVISVIVKYCYCGEVDMDLIFSSNRSLEEEASLLVQLREAGRYFEIQDLSSTAEVKIGNLVFQKNNDKKKYQYAVLFLAELFKRDENKEPLGIAMYLFALRNTMECFCPRDPEDTHLAHPSVLGIVLLGDNRDAYAVVKCLQRWFSLESKSAGNFYSNEDKRALITIAENIDLKRLSTSQLSNIKPCSLFSSERILQAFVHHCKSDEIITETPRTVPYLCVMGTGMAHLEGSYRKVKVPQSLNLRAYAKLVEHNGISCKSIIHYKHAENRWLMSITKNDEAIRLKQSDSGFEVDENNIQYQLYESSCQSLPTEDPEVPPFSGWKRIEGTSEAPIFACMYH